MEKFRDNDRKGRVMALLMAMVMFEAATEEECQNNEEVAKFKKITTVA